MLGFWLVNLLVPGDPPSASITTSSGIWYFQRNNPFNQLKDAIANNQCVNTYSIEIATSLDDGAAAANAALDEVTPILLGLSYLSGLSVTVKHSLQTSDIQILQPTDYWPRERVMGTGNSCVNTHAEFFNSLQAFVSAWPTVNQSEKIFILMHHLLDALGCWSFEDFYLSATTLLQIIAASEERKQGGSPLYFFDAIKEASNRFSITPLNRDFVRMRNNLIHEGKLLGGSFGGTNIEDCSVVASDLMNWFDEYIHVVMGLGTIKKKRFSKNTFMSLNAYSLDQ